MAASSSPFHFMLVWFMSARMTSFGSHPACENFLTAAMASSIHSSPRWWRTWERSKSTFPCST